MFFPAQGAFLLTDRKKTEAPRQVLIQRKNPNLLANAYSVQLLWKENIENAKLLNTKTQWKDLGCKRTERMLFTCLRVSNEARKAEVLVWHSSTDLVTLQVSLPGSQQSEPLEPWIRRQLKFKSKDRDYAIRR